VESEKSNKSVIHKAKTRGFFNHGWLKSYHTFSFAGYYDKSRVHFGMLRVLNDDIILPGEGFGTHPHNNMEIVTIPIYGELAHKDSTGNEEVIHENEVQIMSAGSGLTHSEYNASHEKEVNLLQIWVFPKEHDIEPRYNQKIFNPELMKNNFLTLVSPGKSEDTLWINQDAYFSIGLLEKGKSIDYKIKKDGNGLYVFVMSGSVTAEDEVLDNRDGMGIEDVDSINIIANEDSKVLLIDIPMR
jgi:redox-sensitive bicupin YhaK (pirin superfamily)